MRLDYTDEQWKWVGQKYHEGYTIGELASRLHVHRETVRRHLMEVGFMAYAKDELDPLDDVWDEFVALGHGSNQKI